MYSVQKPGRVLLDYGPTTMIITARRQGKPYTDAALKGAQRAVTLIDELSKRLSLARQTIAEWDQRQVVSCPEVLQHMFAAVKALNEEDFTPLAAVAGAFSDMVLTTVIASGADEAIVNNGGDIAFQLVLTSPPLKVGVVADQSLGKVTHVLTLPRGMLRGGIATSGFGGRSLTKGVASAVTVISNKGSLADAAATSVANAVSCDDDSIKRCRAEELEPLTDISGQLVTMSIGKLPPNKVTKALNSGLKRLKELVQARVLTGGIIFVQGKYAFWPQTLKVLKR